MRGLLAALTLAAALAAPSSAGPVRPFAALDIYSPGNAGRGMEEDGEQFAARLGASQASVDISPAAAYGVRAGAATRISEGLDLGASAGFIRGPGVDGTLTARQGPAIGELHQERHARFVRVMVEPALNVPLSENRSFHLSLGLGAAWGWVDDKFTCSGNVCLMSDRRFKSSWSGFTWELSPYFVFDKLMFGLRVAGFPRFKGTDNQSKMSWNTFGIFGGFRL